MSKPKSLMDRVREEQNTKALEMAAKGVPLVHVPRPVSNETLEQRKARAFDDMVTVLRSAVIDCELNNGKVLPLTKRAMDKALEESEAVEDAMSKEAKGL